MSRSVSVPNNAAWSVYIYPERNGETDHDFGDFAQSWDNFIEDLRNLFIDGFKSLHICDRWLGREDRVILENDHAYIGVSEYNGVVSVWCVPIDDEKLSLHENWAGQIERKAQRTISEAGYEVMVSGGRFSNGEQVFHVLDKPGKLISSKEGVIFA